MKPKLKYLYALAAILMLCGCEKPKNTAKPSHGGFYMIDTLVIHGKSHEIIRERTSHMGGVMHSPECWCGKGGGR